MLKLNQGKIKSLDDLILKTGGSSLKTSHQSNRSKMDLQKSSTKYSMKIMTIFYRIIQMIEEEEKLSN